MRYADAPHVDLSNYYMRLPRLGSSYRWMGYVCVAMAVLWLQAWFRGVGGLWRSSLVAALLACAVILTWHKVYPTMPTGSCPSSAMTGEAYP
jgi:hypothetical protein